MSNYQIGDKFVIEIEEVFTGDICNLTPMLYRMKGFNSLVFDKNGLDRLERLDGDYVNENFGELQNEAYETGKSDGRDEVLNWQKGNEEDAYNKGLNDAWELAKKLFGYSCDTKLSCEDMKKIFGSACEMDILRNNTPQEALAKLEAYEKSKEAIKVGDVVELESEKMLVTRIVGNDTMDVLASDGNVYYYSNMPFIKTGKHIDISAILAEIGKE